MLDEIPNEKNQFFDRFLSLKRIWEKKTPFIEVFVPNFCNFIHFLFRFFPLILYTPKVAMIQMAPILTQLDLRSHLLLLDYAGSVQLPKLFSG